jgi:hypothetical protein
MVGKKRELGNKILALTLSSEFLIYVKEKIMCLIIGNNIEGYVLEEDLTVFKQLEGNDKDGYRTPHQGWEVELGKLLKPDQPEPEISDYGFKKQINGGAIHAYLKVGGRSSIHKAVIPKGSRVWLQDDLSEIAATQMIIEPEEVTAGETDLSRFLEGAANVWLKSGEQKKITDSYNKDDVVGFVLKSGKIVSANFNPTTTVFSNDPLTEQTEQTDFEIAKKDMNGQANTERLKKECSGSGLKAIDGLKDNEYIPSVGELSEAFSEFNRINQIRKALGLEPLPVGYYWSSTIRNRESMWIVRGGGGTHWDDWGYYCRTYDYVLAFLRK